MALRSIQLLAEDPRSRQIAVLLCAAGQPCSVGNDVLPDVEYVLTSTGRKPIKSPEDAVQVILAELSRARNKAEKVHAARDYTFTDFWGTVPEEFVPGRKSSQELESQTPDYARRDRTVIFGKAGNPSPMNPLPALPVTVDACQPKRRPTVVHYMPWSLVTGGAQRMLSQWCKSVGDSWDIYIFTRSDLPSVWDFGEARLIHEQNLPAMKAHIKALAPDLVVIHYPSKDSGWLVDFGVPTVWHVHGEDIFNESVSPEWGIPGTVLSNYQPSIAAKGWDAFPLTVLPLGVDLDAYRPADPDYTPSSPEVLVAGIVGRISREKLPPSFVNALAKWKHGRWLVKIIGNGEVNDYQDEVHAKLDRFDWIEFAGDIPVEDMPAVYRGLDALCIPSDSETGSFALVEGMASGLPIIARNVGGLSFQANGAVILCDDDATILKNLSSLSSSSRRNQFATKSRTEALNRHALAAHTDALTKAYRRAITGNVDDVALILAYTFEDERRNQATLTALRQLAKLDPMPVLRVVVMDDGFRHAEIRDVVEAAGGKLIHLSLQPEHRYVFHKEDLYNYAVRHIPPSIKYMIFLDADTYTTQLDWALLTRRKLVECGDDTVLQPWGEFHDTEDQTLAGWSMCRRIRLDADQWKTHANPGLCIAMTRGCFDSIGGFPTACPAGAGDTMLMLEISGGKYRVDYMVDFPYFAEGFRQVPPKQVDWLPVSMTHVHHGAVNTRGYRTRHEILQAFWPFGDQLYRDANGILCVRAGSPLQYCMERRRRCRTSADVAVLLGEAGVFYPVIRSVESYLQAREADPVYVHQRWGYMKAAGDMMRTVARTGRVLEIGPRNLPLVHNATFMDLDPQWQPEAVIHDAGLAPWPFADGEFTTVVALQMVEHLDGRQPTFFAEAFRVARWLIVSIPWQWTAGEPGHTQIWWTQVDGWTGGMKPRHQFLDKTDPTHLRMVLCYSAEDRTAP